VINAGHWAQKTKSVKPGGMAETPLKLSASRANLLDAHPILTGSQSRGDTECNQPSKYIIELWEGVLVTIWD